jgi:hypothetical protein
MQAERASRDGTDREAADLVGRERRLSAGPGLDLDRCGLGRDELAEQRVPDDLKFDGHVHRAERESANGRGLGPRARRLVRFAGGVVGELREFRVDVVLCEGVLADFDEFGRDGPPGAERLLQRSQQCFVVPSLRPLCSPLCFLDPGVLDSGVLGPAADDGGEVRRVA